MQQEYIAKLESAELPADLKFMLRELVDETTRLLPDLPPTQQRWTRRRLERVIAEATDPTLTIHWWPPFLDLIGKTAQEAGAAGGPVVAAAPTGRFRSCGRVWGHTTR